MKQCSGVNKVTSCLFCTFFALDQPELRYEGPLDIGGRETLTVSAPGG